MSLPELDLPGILTFAVSLARKAGVVILEGSAAMAEVVDIGEKKNSVDLVTEYDVRVEELVKGEARKLYPAFKL